MAKGVGRKLRRTGRRTRTGGKFRSTVSKTSMAFAMPRQVYLPVPAQMYLSCKLTLSGQEAVAAGGQLIEAQSLLAPFRDIGGGVFIWAEYFRPLMRIYSRAAVAKSSCTFQIQNIGATPLEACAAVINQNSFANLPAGVQGLDRLTAFPESRFTMISPADGGNAYQSLSVSVDTSKFLNQDLDHDVCSLATQPGVIAGPVIQNNATAPVGCCYVLNRTNAAGAFILRRTYTFSIRFMDRHAQSQTEEI